jgi:GT2 family glycosyltransferase
MIGQKGLLRGPTTFMVLSVIIVNYNVKFFLEQCLYSVERSLLQLAPPGETEVLVVDNHSTDGSVEYCKERFPRVHFIVNTENKGFSAANNQALKLATGRYILFLNPDTILSEDCCRTCISFLSSTPGAGAAGVRMIDGQGRFLRESRRGFPSAWVAFSKLSGLTALFPRSRIFSGYYLGHLPATQNHPSPVLSGACFCVSREVLDRVGNFDPQFFMYAEDIDLSYRIEKAGYTNYYIADTTILHFKGESTRKDIRYTRIFYKAMSQFRKKHTTGGIPALLNVFVTAGIWLRAGITAIANGLHPASGPSSGSPASHPANGSQQQPRPLNTWLTGDPAAIRQLTAILSNPGSRKFLPGPEQAEEIILCQGDAFLFKDCLDTLQQDHGRVSYKIHAAGSGSLVGSHSQVDLPVLKSP